MALSENGVPKHIAIIMDGNGRWAKKRGLPRNAGHAAGAEAFRNIANYCRTLGVQYLTVYAFSTENWKRSEEEVSGIMKLLGKYLEEALADMEKNRVCFRFFAQRPLPSMMMAMCLGTPFSESAIKAPLSSNFSFFAGADVPISPCAIIGNQIAISSFSLAAIAASTFLMFLSSRSCRSFSAFFWSSSVISEFFFSFLT